MNIRNKLILGTVQMGLPYGINNNRGQISGLEAFQILKRAEEAGIEYLDTAAAYGNSEEVIGHYLKNNNPSSLKVITKFSFRKGDWKDSLQVSIKHLGKEFIETLLFHSFKDYKEHFHQIDEIVKFKHKNKIKHLGVSVYTNHEIDQLLIDDRIDVVQAPFNLLDNNKQREDSFKRAKAAGKEIHVRSAFLQGMFFKNENNLPAQLEPLKETLKELKYMAKENNISIGAFALQYSLSKNYIDRVLIGVDSLNQLVQNLEWFEESIDPEILKQADEICVRNTDLLNPSLWKI